MKDTANITQTTLSEAEKLAGLTFTENEQALMLKGVIERRDDYEKLREVHLANNVPPALQFVPRPFDCLSTSSRAAQGESPNLQPFDRLSTSSRAAQDKSPVSSSPISLDHIPIPQRPFPLEEAAFWPVTQLAQLLRTRQVTSVELTEMYLARLKRYDRQLQCVVTLTEERALAQAKLADEEIANGRYHGPLHGIPWGAKDLLAVKGYPTTWGAAPYREQIIDEDAAVVQRLDEAGAVLVAKLTMGALAWGDVWFGGQTKNPWNLAEGSSGSSAGPAAAVAAGLVGFAIGTETHGSIVSPANRCGITGLRPTFGRVSRAGAMALSWSMDKIGPMCRSVEDCALVFDAIHGADGVDGTAVSQPFTWQPELDITKFRVGTIKSAFDEERANKAADDATLEALRQMGASLIPIELPDYPIEALNFILQVEAAAAFDELTRSNRDDLLVRQSQDAWPNVFRQSRLITAVEYIQANRIRTLVMHEMVDLMATIDLYVAPSLGGDNLLLTNLTGHPAVVLPNGLSAAGIPNSSITFTGKLYNEATILAVAHAYQTATDFHRQRPSLNP